MWTSHGINFGANGTAVLSGRTDQPPPRWEHSAHAHQYLERRLKELEAARRTAASQGTWRHRIQGVLRLGAVLDAAYCLAASRHISETKYLDTRTKLGADPQQPIVLWASPEIVRDYLQRQIDLERSAKASVKFPITKEIQGSARQAYIRWLLALGGALDATACAYCGWWIEAPEYRRLRSAITGTI